jgi:hypothetical protein
MINLKIGSKILFELQKDLSKSALPRYDSTNKDRGSSGKFAEGIISEVNKQFIAVNYDVHDFIGTGIALIPYLENEHYTKGQWRMPGYFKNE